MSYHGFGAGVTSNAGIPFTTRSGYTSSGGSTTVRAREDLVAATTSRLTEPTYTGLIQTKAGYAETCAAAGGRIDTTGKCVASKQSVGTMRTYSKDSEPLFPGGGGGGGGSGGLPGGGGGGTVTEGCPASTPVSVYDYIGSLVGCCPSGFVGNLATNQCEPAGGVLPKMPLPAAGQGSSVMLIGIAAVAALLLLK